MFKLNPQTSDALAAALEANCGVDTSWLAIFSTLLADYDAMNKSIVDGPDTFKQ